MEKILMGRDNPDGHKLEELLKRLQEEIESKSRLLTENSDLTKMIIESNDKIVKLLYEAEQIQINTMKEIEKQRGPNRGPSNPRVS